MTPAEHYAAAEACLAAGADRRQEGQIILADRAVAVAKVHATLATVETGGWPMRQSQQVWTSGDEAPPETILHEAEVCGCGHQRREHDPADGWRCAVMCSCRGFTLDAGGGQ